MMTCIAIDDEPLALDILEDYIKKSGMLILKGIFREAMEGLSFIQQNPVDMIFLDINMPDFTGLQMAQVLPHPHPAVIFCTAYSEYALESYDYEATDYLLKPISFERFLKAVLKVKKHHNYSHPSINQVSATWEKDFPESKPFIFVKTGNEMVKVFASDIIYIEGMGNYITIHTGKRKIMSLQSMQEILQKLPADNFFRIHKSFIVSFEHLVSYERHQVKMINDKKLPIGNTYRQAFAAWIDEKNQ